MTNKMLIDAVHQEETRVVVMREDRVEEFDFESANRRQLKGNIYLAKVTRVEPSLQAAFVDYGGNRHGFLAFSEIHPDYYQIPVADRQELLRQEQEDDDDDNDNGAPEAPVDDMSSTDGDLDDDVKAADPQDTDTQDEGESDTDQEKVSADSADTITPEATDNEDSDTSEEPASAAPQDMSADDTPVEEDTKSAPLATDPSDSVSSKPSKIEEEEEEEEVPAHKRKAEPDPDEEAQADIESAAPAPVEQPSAFASDEPTEAAATEETVAAEASDAEQGIGASDDVSVDAMSDDAPDTDSPSAEEPVVETAAKDDSDADIASEEIEAPETIEKVAEEPVSKPQKSAKATPDDDASDDDEDGDTPPEQPEVLGSEDALEETPVRRKPRPRPYKIQEVIKRRQVLLVQVVKEERGNKGAALTTYLSLAGRYSVLMPNTPRGGGISRKISNSSDRQRLKAVANELDVPQGMGVILRTAGASRTKTEIKRDFEYLMRLWEKVRTTTLDSIAPVLVYEEGSLVKRAIRDLYTRDIDEVMVSGDNSYKEAKDFMRMLMPSHAKNVKPYKETAPIFVANRIEPQLEALYNPQVTLKSGGYIVINQTEALVAIDVNSGRATKEHNIEDTALRTNLEAASEVARQLRLRDLAGLIVIDFIDMEERRNNRSVERRLKEALKNDRARIQVGKISSFGLLEMSRQRLRSGIMEGSTEVCPACHGTGLVRSTESVALHILRAIEARLYGGKTAHLSITCSTAAALYILNNKRAYLRSLEEGFGVSVAFDGSDAMHSTNHTITEVDGGLADAPAAAVISQLDASDEVEVSAPAEEEESSGRKRRRRRRRRDRDDTQTDQQALDVEAEEETAEASSDADSDGERTNDNERADESENRGRRRRGGRRRRRRGNRDDADAQASPAGDTETSETVSDTAGPNGVSASPEPSTDTSGPDDSGQAPTALNSEGNTEGASSLDVETEPAPEQGLAASAEKTEAPTGSEDAREAAPLKKPRRRRSTKKTEAEASTANGEMAQDPVNAKPSEPLSAGSSDAPVAENPISNDGADGGTQSNADAPAPETATAQETVVSSTTGSDGEDEEQRPARRGWWQRRFMSRT